MYLHIKYIQIVRGSFADFTGIKARHRFPADVTSSDLCYTAAEKLIAEMGWEKSDIGALVFVSQTPDYILSATSCVLQQRFGLSKECSTFDLSLGCSGWVYTMSVITSLMQNGSIRKGLLLAGDTITKICSPDNKSTYLLFGDAGTATALDGNGKGFKYLLNSDGNGIETIIIREGGYCSSVTSKSLEENIVDDTISRSGIDLELNGMDVFSFGIIKAPKSVKQLCEHFCIDKDSVDIFSFHQVNKMMNEMIRKKLKFPEEKVPYCMDEFGNTSCASIPLVWYQGNVLDYRMKSCCISHAVLMLVCHWAVFTLKQIESQFPNLLKYE